MTPNPASPSRPGGLPAAAVALALSAWLAGCVVAPAPGYPPAQPQAMPPAYPTAAYPAAGEEWVPPQEYVVGGAPVYYDVDPGVAYYPMYLNTPGSCNCVVPMRYANGVWLGLGGVVLHRGNLSLARPAPYHYDAWTRSGGVWRGYSNGYEPDYLRRQRVVVTGGGYYNGGAYYNGGFGNGYYNGGPRYAPPAAPVYTAPPAHRRYAPPAHRR